MQLGTSMNIGKKALGLLTSPVVLVRRAILLSILNLKLFPKSKLLSDRYMNLKKAVCPLGWAMAGP